MEKINIIKRVVLSHEVRDKDGNILAVLSVTLAGDESTPNVKTEGGTQNIIGYDDYGTPIFSQIDEKELVEVQKQFMANAIFEQKKLTEANGLNPDAVNMIGDK